MTTGVRTSGVLRACALGAAVLITTATATGCGTQQADSTRTGGRPTALPSARSTPTPNPTPTASSGTASPTRTPVNCAGDGTCVDL
ncbi:hypothetical protein [Yinghuangia seranimata]|uniref:hypothetical protein n=1 Tax=Yinghuangia seranimata TaxID=408067 RepID=UPI00248CAD80|nr:hypothetical protein [Yinghuangia seranimata]MDI2130010.1 hypothetical protein [Yinghuangia seranimata]